MIISPLASAVLRDLVAPAPVVGGSALLVRARSAHRGLRNGTTVEFSTSQDNSTGSPPDRHSC